MAPCSTCVTACSSKLLPRFVSFKGDNGQLLTIAMSDGIPYLTFTASDACRLATHEVIYNKDLENVVVIRSSNGRYWRRDDDNWIGATGEETPLFSDTKFNFKIVSVSEESNTIALQSMADGSYLRWYSQSYLHHGINAVASCCDLQTHLQFCDASETALVLPRLLTLKSDNGFFLDAKYDSCKDPEINWLKFGNSKGDLPTAHELIYLPNGNLLIRNVSSSKYWRCSSVNWVWADVEQSDVYSNSACHFEPVKVSRTTVALRSVSSGKFLKRYTEYWKDALCGLASDINDSCAQFTVGDAVVSQTITSISYNLKMAEVVEIESFWAGSGSVTNTGDCTTDLQVQLKFNDTVARSHNWSNAGTFKAGPLSSFTIGVPEVSSAEGSLTVGALQCFKTRLCSTIKESVLFQSSYCVKNVEPGEEVTVKVECTKGKCRVPFTYTVKPVRVDGVKLREVNCIDGLFEGVGIFDTRAVVTSNKKKPVYLPVCCSYGSRGARRASL